MRRTADCVGHLGGMQQCLGGDTSAVQARAAELVLLDQCDRQAELLGAQGAGVPAGSAAEDENVDVAHRTDPNATTGFSTKSATVRKNPPATPPSHTR